MKKQEKHHLKEDPFISFMEKFFHFVHDNLRQIAIGATIAVLLVLLILSVLVIRSAGVTRSNRLFAAAVKIKNNTVLTTAEKVERLSKLGKQRGIAAVAQLYIAQAYCLEQNWPKAEEVVKSFSGSHIIYLNSAQQILLADIYTAMEKRAEAEKVLQSLLNDNQNTLGNDFLLLKLAKLKTDENQTESAKTYLNQLIADFPDSNHLNEAQTLLTSLENS